MRDVCGMYACLLSKTLATDAEEGLMEFPISSASEPGMEEG